MARRARIIEDEVVMERPINSSYLKRLFRYLLPYKTKVIIALILMVIAASASLAGPTLMRFAIDDSIATHNVKNLVIAFVALVSCSGIDALCTRYRVRMLETAGRNAIATLRKDLFEHVQSLSFHFFDNRSAGKIMVRIVNDVNSLNDLITNGIVNVIIDCFVLVIVLVIMFSTNVLLTLISLGLIPILVFLAFKVQRTIRKNWRNVRLKISNLNGYLHESLQGMRVTQAFTRERENMELFNDTITDIRNTWMKAMKINLLFGPSMDITGTIGIILVYWFGVTILGTNTAAVGGVTVGTLLSVIWYQNRFWEPLNNLSNVYNSLLVASASMERIFEILDTPVEVHDKAGAQPLPTIQGEVEFDNVVFSYDPEKIILKGVSFHITPGQTIALVGPTGSGKTTVVNLLSRFYDVTGGSVKIDGHDIRDVQLHSLHKQMGIMMQDSFIFSGTIMDNIRYGKLDATDDQVIEAAKAVNAHEFIVQMEKGYLTEVNERGSRLSVGQKQLISFARALLADPRILILDEATSSIDTRTEMIIQKALERLLEGRTSFVIAHRLSTIRKADRIIVIHNGTLLESGNHDELIAQRGFYYDLCKAQYRFLNDAEEEASAQEETGVTAE